MAYNTKTTLDKLACTDYVNFGKCQDRFGRISWYEKFFRLLGRETQRVQEGRNQTISTGTKLDNGRGRL